MFSVEHASSMGPAVMEEEEEDKQQASCLVANKLWNFHRYWLVINSVLMVAKIFQGSNF